MGFWNALNIRKKLLYAILAMALVLGVAGSAITVWAYL